jgi:hypothetical protein
MLARCAHARRLPGAPWSCGCAAEDGGTDRSGCCLRPYYIEAEQRIETLGRQLRREWEVAPLAEEWENAVGERLGQAWARMRSRPASAGAYVQERLFR